MSGPWEAGMKTLVSVINKPADWAAAIFAGVAAGYADGRYDILAAAYFDPTTTGIYAALTALGIKTAGTGIMAARYDRHDAVLMRHYLGELIDQIEEARTKSSLQMDMKIARRDLAKLQIIRQRVEALIAEQPVATKGKEPRTAKR